MTNETQKEIMERTAELNPLRASSPEAFYYCGKPKFTTLLELTQKSEKAINLGGEREPYLLVDNLYDPGDYLPLPLYDYSDTPTTDGKYLCDVHRGQLLLEPDTMLYWK